MNRIKGIREKMWAGQTAPFFCLRFLESGKAKRPARGLFSERWVISVPGLRSCQSCHPTLRRRAERLSSR
nr:hypothetical protein C1892_10820 [Pseudomonas sp. MPBD7-1]